ncbi:MAG: UDP-N-acetylglucosamine 1-carboxyvinyltransferase [bacterium]|nr:UDP-N-acetylglucosamine 1-carboxyvinyltransferase [bacterium]
MAFIEVIGGRHLQGEIPIQGSKNAVLPILAASILHNGITRIKNCPKIIDVYHMIKLLESIGCIVTWEQDGLTIDATEMNYSSVDKKYVSSMRSSIILLGALLGRNKNVTISYPGGCAIGARPIDLHLKAIKEMNVQVIHSEDIIFCSTSHLTGAKISLASPSVGATENVILAAVKADGITIIDNAAMEPEITELCLFLVKMGARISGAGSKTIMIEGVKEFRDVEYTLVSDRIVMGTYLAAVAGAGGSVTLRGNCCKENETVINTLRTMGCRIGVGRDYVNICSSQQPRAVPLIETETYPGFPTDMQSQIMSVLTIASGTSLIVENIFESRYKTVKELAKMGADIYVSGKAAQVNGVAALTGCDVRAYDLRGGAGLVIAGLIANGTSRISGIEYIERGYEDISKDLANLGADIRKVESSL